MDGEEITAKSPERHYIWNHPSGLRGDDDLPTLEEEALYLEVVVAEASLACEKAERPEERLRYRCYLQEACARYNEVCRRLEAFEDELSSRGL